MKKLLAVITCAILGASSAFAQTSAGTLAITAAFGYSDYRYQPQNQGSLRTTTQIKQYTVAPRVGYFVADNLEVGVHVGFHSYEAEGKTDHSSQKSFSLNKSENQSYRVFIRKYLFLSDKVAMYADASSGASVTTKKIINKVSNSEDITESYSKWHNKEHNFTAALSPGLSYFISDKFGMNVNLGALTYGRSKLKQESEQHAPKTSELKTNTVALNFSSENVTLGLSYYFNR